MNPQRGFLRTILIIIIAIFILSYFGFDLRKTADSPTTKSNFQYVKELVIKGIEFILKPLRKLWVNGYVQKFVSPIADSIRNFDGKVPSSVMEYKVVPN